MLFFRLERRIPRRRILWNSPVVNWETPLPLGMYRTVQWDQIPKLALQDPPEPDPLELAETWLELTPIDQNQSGSIRTGPDS